MYSDDRKWTYSWTAFYTLHIQLYIKNSKVENVISQKGVGLYAGVVYKVIILEVIA